MQQPLLAVDDQESLSSSSVMRNLLVLAEVLQVVAFGMSWTSRRAHLSPMEPLRAAIQNSMAEFAKVATKVNVGPRVVVD